MRKIRIYVDSSAVSGVFNERTAEQTKPFWDAVEDGEVAVILSDVLEQEVERAPQCVRNFFDTLLKLPNANVERVVSMDESNALATQYVAEKVVGPTSLDDCKHIALATIANADVLVSWNFKHIVNVKRIQGYNGVNRKLGYSQIEIRTPYEVIHDET